VQPSTMRATRTPNFSRNFVEAREAALILDGIMQQRGDDFVFTAAMLNDDGRNAGASGRRMAGLCPCGAGGRCSSAA